MFSYHSWKSLYEQTCRSCKLTTWSWTSLMYASINVVRCWICRSVSGRMLFVIS